MKQNTLTVLTDHQIMEGLETNIMMMIALVSEKEKNTFFSGLISSTDLLCQEIKSRLQKQTT